MFFLSSFLFTIDYQGSLFDYRWGFLLDSARTTHYKVKCKFYRESNGKEAGDYKIMKIQRTFLLLLGLFESSYLLEIFI